MVFCSDWREPLTVAPHHQRELASYSQPRGQTEEGGRKGGGGGREGGREGGSEGERE